MHHRQRLLDHYWLAVLRWFCRLRTLQTIASSQKNSTKERSLPSHKGHPWRIKIHSFGSEGSSSSFRNSPFGITQKDSSLSCYSTALRHAYESRSWCYLSSLEDRVSSQSWQSKSWTGAWNFGNSCCESCSSVCIRKARKRNDWRTGWEGSIKGETTEVRFLFHSWQRNRQVQSSY